MNLVMLIGRLTRDPELRYAAGSQTAVCKFSLAVDRPNRQGHEREADFPRVTVFGRQAENCDKYLAKGRKVAVQGRLQTGSYKNKDGYTVYTTDVIADRVEFLEWGDRAQQGMGQEQVRRNDSSFGNRTYSDNHDNYEDQNAYDNQDDFGYDNRDENDAPDSFRAIDDDVPF
jgi:single-strand DNA-binding protein